MSTSSAPLCIHPTSRTRPDQGALVPCRHGTGRKSTSRPLFRRHLQWWISGRGGSFADNQRGTRVIHCIWCKNVSRISMEVALIDTSDNLRAESNSERRRRRSRTGSQDGAECGLWLETREEKLERYFCFRWLAKIAVKIYIALPIFPDIRRTYAVAVVLQCPVK